MSQTEAKSFATKPRKRTGALWVIGYLVLLGAILYGMPRWRDSVIARMDTPEARAEWTAWREAEPNKPDYDGPIRRRPPKSTEPPSLILMRDYYGVMLCGALLFGSLLYGAAVFSIRGVLATSNVVRADGE